MRSIKSISLLLISVSLLNGCADFTNQEVGAVTGGLVGAAVGSTLGKGHGRTAAMIGGTLIGTAIGSAVGRSMDDLDAQRVSAALETTPTNQPYHWSNPDSGYSYTVTPTRTIIADSGQPCREFTTTAWIGGRNEQVYGKACRDAAGDWKIIG